MKITGTRNEILLVLAALAPAVYANDQGASAILTKLESEYKVTKTTNDRTDIVTAGSVVVLHRDKLLMVTADSTGNPCMNNTYRKGRITQNMACRLMTQKTPIAIPGRDRVPATRYFVSNEKFWVTRIDMKDTAKESEIVLDFFTDAISDVRYRGILTIPLGASTPTPDEALRAVAEVITVVPPEDGKKDGNKIQAGASEPGAEPAVPAQPEPAPAPIEPPPPPSPDPTEVNEGQTIEQVVAALGQPSAKLHVGTKDIYTYKSLKVTFVNGKVNDVE